MPLSCWGCAFGGQCLKWANCTYAPVAIPLWDCWHWLPVNFSHSVFAQFANGGIKLQKKIKHVLLWVMISSLYWCCEGMTFWEHFGHYETYGHFLMHLGQFWTHGGIFECIWGIFESIWSIFETISVIFEGNGTFWPVWHVLIINVFLLFFLIKALHRLALQTTLNAWLMTLRTFFMLQLDENFCTRRFWQRIFAKRVIGLYVECTQHRHGLLWWAAIQGS